jgi:hypothetical protein
VSNFYTDVIRKDPRFESTDRIGDLLLLEPVTRQAVAAIVTGAAAQGIILRPLETYRSANRQEMLFANGATKLCAVGVHHYGLACDFVVMVNGEPTWKVDYGFLRPLAAANGLIWGGDWGTPGIYHSFRDSDHVQRCTVAEQQALFAGTWYPEDTTLKENQ